MAEKERAKREAKRPTWLDEVEDPDVALNIPRKSLESVFVFKILQRKDVNRDLVGREVFTLWPENGKWYRGKIRKCNPADMSALIFYEDTDEKEEADLEELISEGQISFLEERPKDYVCGAGEILQGPHNISDEVQTADVASSDDDLLISDTDVDEEPDDIEVSVKGRKRKPKIRPDFLNDEELGDELPLSLRFQKGTQHSLNHKKKKHELLQQAEKEAANKLLQAATKTSANRFYSDKGSKGGNSASEVLIRQKVKDALMQGLEMAAQELSSEGDSRIFKPSSVASAVEEALYELYNGATKEYKTKFRSLQFNLKDSQNLELRAHVLRGDISPQNFVRMTANELASKELAEYRKRKEEEALKMSVLDADAASKFSTAAALESRSQYGPVTSLTLNIGQIKPTNSDRLGKERSTVELEPQVDLEASEKESNLLRDSDILGRTTEGQNDKASRNGNLERTNMRIDWASIKSASAIASKGRAGKVDDIGLDLQAKVKVEKEDQRQVSWESSEVENIKKIFSSSSDTTKLGPNIWTGSVSVPGVGNGMMTASALAGTGDLKDLLGNGMQVRGRLSLDKLNDFLSELHLSKHRTATVGIMRPLIEMNSNSNKSEDFGKHYIERKRAGVAETMKGVEVYLIPASDLAKTILEAVDVLYPSIYRKALGANDLKNHELHEEMLLSVAIHRKDLPANRMPLKSNAEAIKPETSALPSGLDLNAISALATAMGTNAPIQTHLAQTKGSTTPAEQVIPAQQTSMLPADLDLSAISALANALGVNSTEPSDPRQKK